MVGQGANIRWGIVRLVLDGFGGPFADDEVGFDVEPSEGQEDADPYRSTGCARDGDDDFLSATLAHSESCQDD